ncbi:hypothetical protein ACIOC2_08740 [Streptomyces sp. NPDC088337]|uniref:hypothetical protein n=1 Tax=unclassified Streptomyces TaxID=2593676 RepID=UPI00381F0A78
MSDTTVANMLKRHCVELAEQHPGFLATSFTPHDFRRLLATEHSSTADSRSTSEQPYSGI